MSLFTADAIFTSSISEPGNSRPSMDCDVIRSSTDLATSTSLIHNIATVRQPEQEHTSVSNWNSNTGSLMCQGIYRNAVSRSDSTDFPSKKIEDKFLMHDSEDSRSKTSWQSEELVLHNSADLFSTPFFVPQLCLYQLASICKKTMPNPLNFRRVLTTVHLEQVDLQKRVLMNPTSSVQHAASKSRSQPIIPVGLGILIGWLGTTHSCSLFQDHKNSIASFKEFSLSCNSWIWTTSWVIVDLLSSFCVESSSLLNCPALSASVQQIRRHSSISWQFIARSSWTALFLISNSSHSQVFFPSSLIRQLIWLIKFHPLGLELHANFIKSKSAFCILHSLLSNSNCASDNLVWAAHSPWKARSAFFSGKSWMSLCSDRSLPFPQRMLHTLQISISFTFRQRFPEAWKRLNVSPGFLHAWMCLRTRNTEWRSTYFALLRKQWWSQPSHVCCVVELRRIQSGREIVNVRVETASCRR